MASKRKSSEISGGALKDLVFCMTGTMSIPRADMEAYIIANGGEVVKTVTNKCSHLLSSESGTKKCQDAERKGVIVVNEEWLQEICGKAPETSSKKKPAKATAKAAPSKGTTKPPPKKQAPAKSGSGGALEGLTFCITGTMSVPRAKMEALIVANGGSVAKSVTNKCTHLLSSETGTKKCADAESKGVIVVDEPWVRSKCNDAEENESDHDEDEEDEEEEDEEEAPSPVKAKPQPVAPQAATSDSVYLECPSSSGGKFWRCTLDGSGTTVTFGKVGSNGSTQVKEHGTEEAARKFFEKVLREKKNKGYAEAPEAPEPLHQAKATAKAAPSKGTTKPPPKKQAPAKSGSGGALEGLTFCITGTMSVPRAKMEALIVANGGSVAKSVTNKCTHLLSSETGTKKCADAESKGVIVVDEPWVRSKCNDAEENESDHDEDEEDEEEEDEEEAPSPVKAKPQPVAPQAATSDSVYLECPSSSGGKFWRCTLDGSGTTVTFGKVGSNGSTQVKEHGTEEAARKFFEKVLREKKNKGYA